MQRAFLCHSSHDSRFTLGLAAYLNRHFAEVFLYEERQRSDEGFAVTINRELARCNVLVTVLGFKVSSWQVYEAGNVANRKGLSFLTVCLPDAQIPDELLHLGSLPLHRAADAGAASVREAARWIVGELGLAWRGDDLPLDPHLFSYEKDIIAFYLDKAHLEGSGEPAEGDCERWAEIRRMVLYGCPGDWPEVEKRSGATTRNGLDPNEIGVFRPDSARVLTSALVRDETPPAAHRLSFPEAGPRDLLYYPRNNKLTVAILVSGGIAPGINAVVNGIVQRHWQYARGHQYEAGLTILGLRNGFRAFDHLDHNHFLLAGDRGHYQGVQRRLETSHHVFEGGSILGTSRAADLIDLDRRESTLADIVANLSASKVDLVYVIGGDGSMRL